MKKKSDKIKSEIYDEVLRIDVVTAFPQMFESVISSSMIRISQDKNLVKINFHNLHDYAGDKFQHIDNDAFGGGAGMVIECEPVYKCIENLKSERNYDKIIYTAADGKTYNQKYANEISLCRNIIILAGHYKGIDQRIREGLITDEISIGDYVLSGGELAAMIIIDSICRLIPGVMSDAESLLEDSFMEGLLEPPIYTRPAEFRGMKVPDVLLSGNHKEIEKWRYAQSIEKTKKLRPDLMREND